MSNMSTEEKSPLLYYEEKCEEKKKGHSEKHNRLRDISAGTTHVFTRFPDYVSTWWVTAAFFVLLLFMMFLLLLSTITAGVLRIPRCVANEELDNRSVHLVHTEDNWTPGEIEIVEKIVKTYTGYKVHLVLIQKVLNNEIRKRSVSTSTISDASDATAASRVSTQKSIKKVAKIKKSNERKKRKVHDFNTDAKKLLEMILHGKMWEKNFTNHAPATTTFTTVTPPSDTTTTPSPTTTLTTFEDILSKYPEAITVETTTYNKAFFNSPLYPYWKGLNDPLKIFAVRVLQLWQYGGISFDLRPMPGNHTDHVIKSPIDAIYKRKVLRFVLREKSTYEALSEKVVAADDEGLHMESRVPCHAFFGQILMILRGARPYSTVRSVIQDAVAVFCHYYSVEKKYCDKIEIM